MFFCNRNRYGVFIFKNIEFWWELDGARGDVYFKYHWSHNGPLRISEKEYRDVWRFHNKSS